MSRRHTRVRRPLIRSVEHRCARYATRLQESVVLMARAREVRNANHVSKVGTGRNGESPHSGCLTVSHSYSRGILYPLSFSRTSIRSSRRETAVDGGGHVMWWDEDVPPLLSVPSTLLPSVHGGSRVSIMLTT